MKEKNYKATILKSAEEIIKTQGFKCLTVSNIVQQSKISNRNFYECFSSKEELLAELTGMFRGVGIEIPNERKMILEQAEDGIAHQGFNNITLETIANAAGINRGTIYKHFSDKYELLESCIEYQFAKLKDIISMIYKANEEKPEEFIKQYIQGYGFSLNNSYESSLFTEAWSHLNYRPKIRSYVLDLQEHIRELFVQCLKTGMSQGIFKKDLKLDSITDFMLILLGGMPLYLAKEHEDVKITKDHTDVLLNAVLRMIRTEKE